jgi:hypothetical protein
MLYQRMLDIERRRSAPVGAAALALARAGSADHARRWALAAREAGLDQFARETVRAIALIRRTGGRDEAPIARRHGDLCFYRTLALRCRDAARRLASQRRAAAPQTETKPSDSRHGASVEQQPRS